MVLALAMSGNGGVKLVSEHNPVILRDKIT